MSSFEGRNLNAPTTTSVLPAGTILYDGLEESVDTTSDPEATVIVEPVAVV